MRSPETRPAQISHHTISHTEQPAVQGSLSEHATPRKTGPVTVFNRFETQCYDVT